MARAWRVKLKGLDSVVYTCHVHDDGGWEPDPALPAILYTEYTELVARTSLSIAQFTRLGWTGIEIEKE